MIELEQRTTTRNESVMVGLTCDRCGKKTRTIVGIGPLSWPFEGVYVRGVLYPTRNAGDKIDLEFEFCGACASELSEWVKAYIAPPEEWK